MHTNISKQAGVLSKPHVHFFVLSIPAPILGFLSVLSPHVPITFHYAIGWTHYKSQCLHDSLSERGRTYVYPPNTQHKLRGYLVELLVCKQYTITTCLSQNKRGQLEHLLTSVLAHVNEPGSDSLALTTNNSNLALFCIGTEASPW